MTMMVVAAKLGKDGNEDVKGLLNSGKVVHGWTGYSGKDRELLGRQ